MALLSVGGPAGQISVMHRLLVAERRWVSDADFLHALNFCMVLPGPEALQLATYLGWRQRGVVGALVSGGLFIAPGLLSILLLSWLTLSWQGYGLWQAALAGLQAAVVAVMAAALLRLGRRTLVDRPRQGLAVAALLALAVGLPFPLVLVFGALAGLRWFVPTDLSSPQSSIQWRHALKVLGGGALVWALPMLVIVLAFGPSHVLAALGGFFAKVSLLTFGGAYAVLGYVTEVAVEGHQWVAAADMMDALAFAEATPGPLIQAVQHIGYVAGWRAPQPWTPGAMALAGALITTWSVFVPSITLVLAGAPSVEGLGQRPRVAAALQGMGAVVVGVIAHLALWFGLQVLWPASGFSVSALVLMGLAALLLGPFQRGPLLTLLLCAVVAVAWQGLS